DSAFIDLGKEDPRFVGFGWSPPQLRSGRWVRVTRADRARLFLPLEVASTIELTFTASVRPAAADVGIVINEKPAGSFRVTPGFDEYTVRVPALYWKEGVNRLDLTPRFAEPKSVLLLEKIGAHRSVVSPSRLPGAAQGR
ncbi:MAG TPA: hypothetical protein VEK15_00080, partial [Vicinamibacteria bacterium]|nr:hypothetical protein [Vicinamibacteria bacterium]